MSDRAWGLEQLTDRDRENFARCVNALLGQSFLLRASEKTKRDYYFVDQHAELFRNFFSSIGWDFMLDRANGVCHVRSTSAEHRINLTAVQTLVVLILRLLYEQQRKQLSMTQEVVVRVEDIQVQYMAVRGSSRPIEKGVLRETMALLARHNLVHIMDEDVTDADCRIVLYPSLPMALSPASVSEVHAKIEAFADRGGQQA